MVTVIRLGAAKSIYSLRLTLRVLVYLAFVLSAVGFVYVHIPKVRARLAQERWYVHVSPTFEEHVVMFVQATWYC